MQTVISKLAKCYEGMCNYYGCKKSNKISTLISTR